MQGYSIAQAAERTGFTPSALRFYEQNGLVRPDRTNAGYRSYGDEQIEHLRFIGRAKGFGLSLDEIGELLGLLSQDQCSPVRRRLRALVDAKIDEAEARAGELIAFASDLRKVAPSLEGPDPEGPCDDTCGCVSDAGSVGISLGRRTVADVPAACSLESGEVAGRVAEWQAAVGRATVMEPTTEGVILRFLNSVDLPALAALIAAEQACCPFFTFTLTVAGVGVALDIGAPSDARALVDSLVGAR